MASVGTKRSLPDDGDDVAPDRPQKKIAVSNEADIISEHPRKKIAVPKSKRQTSPPPADSQRTSHNEGTQTSHLEHSSGSDAPSSSTQPTSQEPPSQPSLPRDTSTNGDKLPRIPKRPADEEAPRPRKRPGAGARIDKARSDAVLEKRKREEEEALKIALSRGGDEVVKQHYNLVPQRGREWRSTESKIKGLRKYNNWVKSVLINRFSQPDNRDAPPLRVLDIGCGKGGDLQKWQAAPHLVGLYVGIDPAEVSIDQAKDRYAEMKRGGGRSGRGGRAGFRGGRQQPPLYDAEFIAQDAFGQPIANIPVVQHVGFDAAGNSRWGGGGFDVVSMMFCMHYAFESESKARGMLTNVSGSLKKGGRFLGVIPNSDIIRSNVKRARQGEQSPVEWGNGIYRVRFPGQTPDDGIFRPPFGWKYNYFMEEAVEEVPEFVVPWEAFRALAEDYNLEMMYRKPFAEVWKEEQEHSFFGPLSERMGVRERNGGPLMVSEEEMDAASFYHAFCFYKT